MKQTGFVDSSSRSAFSEAEISDEQVAQVNFQFSFYYAAVFFFQIVKHTCKTKPSAS